MIFIEEPGDKDAGVRAAGNSARCPRTPMRPLPMQKRVSSEPSHCRVDALARHQPLIGTPARVQRDEPLGVQFAQAGRTKRCAWRSEAKVPMPTADEAAVQRRVDPGRGVFHHDAFLGRGAHHARPGDEDVGVRFAVLIGEPVGNGVEVRADLQAVQNLPHIFARRAEHDFDARSFEIGEQAPAPRDTNRRAKWC